MSTVLLTFTGFHDPFSKGLVGEEEQPGPILTLVREMPFDRVILFSTPATRSQSEATQHAIAEVSLRTAVAIEDLPLLDPTDYGEIRGSILSWINKAKREFANDEFWISIASGTPQMHVVWLALVASGHLNARILNTRPPRYVTKDKPLISEVSLAPDLRSLAGTTTWKFESLKHALSDSEPLSDTARIGSLAVSNANDLRSMRLNAGGEEQLYEFGKAAQAAGIVGDVPWLIVLDEVNLARIEYYFADFLSVLEDQDSKKWRVELLSFDPTTEGAQGPFHLVQNRMLQIPENTWFIGTANQDESTFEITDKVYDRAQVIDFQQRHQTNGVRGRSSQRRVSLSELRGAFETATSDVRNSLGDKELAYLDRLDTLLVNEFDITFGNRILDQIKLFVPVYVACGGTKSEAFDVQFSRKILRKLRSLHEASDKRALERLTEELTDPPSGWDPLKSAIEAVDIRMLQ